MYTSLYEGSYSLIMALYGQEHVIFNKQTKGTCYIQSVCWSDL